MELSIMCRLIIGLIFLLLSFNSFSNPSNLNGIYLSGFIANKTNNQSIEKATVVITHKHTRINSIKSQQNGWYETLMPLDKEFIGKEISITVFQRGYEPILNHPYIVKEHFNSINIQMTPMENFYLNEHEDENKLHGHVKYGYIYNKKKSADDILKPVNGAIITVFNSDDTPITGAVSRNSGYFSLYYPYKKTSEEKTYNFTVEHYEHNTYDGVIDLNSEQELKPIGIEQSRHRYSIGLALQTQYTGDKNNKASGAAMLLNLTWLTDKVLVVDNFFPRYGKSRFIGVDISAGLIPFRATNNGNDEIDYVKVYGIGISYKWKKFIFPFRTGLTYNDNSGEKDIAWYFGVNIPFYYF